MPTRWVQRCTLCGPSYPEAKHPPGAVFKLAGHGFTIASVLIKPDKEMGGHEVVVSSGPNTCKDNAFSDITVQIELSAKAEPTKANLLGNAVGTQFPGYPWTQGSTLVIAGDLSKDKKVTLNLDAALKFDDYKVELRGEGIPAQVCSR